MHASSLCVCLSGYRVATLVTGRSSFDHRFTLHRLFDRSLFSILQVISNRRAL